MDWDLEIEIARVDERRFSAAISVLPGVLCYGLTQAEAIGRAQAMALHVLADRLEHGEIAEVASVHFHPKGGAGG
ncbi:MAG: type II toxin-antitoxin system HicB family antitoxin [Planctomycetes bacterium]|nr:type II toxin-antitoxin system HicB family antitoxin [Planctomycetota bacterium]